MLTVIVKQFSKGNVPFSLLVAMDESLEDCLLPKFGIVSLLNCNHFS